MDGLVRIRRALLSVSDKRGVVELARALSGMGVELISTGGTAKALAAAGLRVTTVEEVTGFPEMMDGRVKTLHPMVHGGLLAVRDEKSHTEAMSAHGIGGIDLLCVNLYPFEQTIAREGVTRPEAVEQIDIGGPAMVRSAAKNHEWVAVVTDPSQYDALLEEMSAHGGATTRGLRRTLAGAAFARTSAYDAAITNYLSAGSEGGGFPVSLRVAMERRSVLRYGENPHQRAALYAAGALRGASVVNAEQLHGKELSYNNINDAAAALELVRDLASAHANESASCVIKHANPCGAAVAADVRTAADLAMAGDPVAAYGGILAVSRVVDIPTADRLCQPGAFLEVILAPGFEPGALERLRDRWANVRLLAVGEIEPARAGAVVMRSIAGGMLVQDRDAALPDVKTWTHSAGPRADEATLRAASAVWVMCKHLASNAIVIGGADGASGGAGGAGGVRMFGAGAGQMDRVGACKVAVSKAGALARGAIAASDAFFPFADGPEVLIKAGVGVIVHPGGSKRDAETFDLCDKHGVTCLTTGVRHFRH